MQNKEIVIS